MAASHMSVVVKWYELYNILLFLLLYFIILLLLIYSVIQHVWGITGLGVNWIG